jgi:hypothetical protein
VHNSFEFAFVCFSWILKYPTLNHTSNGLSYILWTYSLGYCEVYYL